VRDSKNEKPFDVYVEACAPPHIKLPIIVIYLLLVNLISTDLNLICHCTLYNSLKSIVLVQNLIINLFIFFCRSPVIRTVYIALILTLWHSFHELSDLLLEVSANGILLFIFYELDMFLDNTAADVVIALSEGIGPVISRVRRISPRVGRFFMHFLIVFNS